LRKNKVIVRIDLIDRVEDLAFTIELDIQRLQAEYDPNKGYLVFWVTLDRDLAINIAELFPSHPLPSGGVGTNIFIGYITQDYDFELVSLSEGGTG
jgi:hypothetical protein